MKKIYVGATRQNRGKTTLCLGLISALIKKGLKVGFIKPVGQRYITVDGERIDEDAVLVKEIYGCDCRIKDTSPIAIERGFTRRYIEGKAESLKELKKKIHTAFEKVQQGKDIVIVEGTGHAGVGSVFDLPNPVVAKELGLKAIIVSAGGIGQPIDEIVLNKSFFEKENVEVIGAVINKVNMKKYEKINKTVRRSLKRKNIDVFGIIPFVPLLSYITMELIVDAMEGELIAGKGKMDLLIKNIVVGAMAPHEALSYFGEGVLVITPGTREDVILAIMSSSTLEHKKGVVSGMVLTGGTKPHPAIMKLINKLQVPTYVVKKDTYSAALEVHDLLVKTRPSDKVKIEQIADIVSSYVDVDRLLKLL